jgi:hypothetical protein
LRVVKLKTFLFDKNMNDSTLIDQEVNDALDNPISILFSISYMDFKPFIMKYILKC